ncbi:MAG: 50S ribosomal protein L4 [Planctomycetes bacterium]|nr:50S ribosomal protein L4 [Planctomycetota bacterium]MBI3836007.1 50S ribosomal protein L4 [Planctomycetota bacterium]
MLSVPVFKMSGERAGEVQVDPEWLGGRVRPQLIKQAVVTFLDHQWQRSARTKGRADVEGSTRKLYRQKGTGNARAGMIRTPVRRGGGRTFAKRVPPHVKELPKQMRRLARDSAVLAKIKANEVLIIDNMAFGEPKTKPFAMMLKAIGANHGCVLAMEKANATVHCCGRNIADTDIRVVDELSAYEVLRRRHLVFTKPAFLRLTEAAKAGHRVLKSA